jgi:deazaflavin-dependent oxidoreductase (nitroreductase family)
MNEQLKDGTTNGASTEEIRKALSRGGVIDITTTGRQSGQARRIEIAFHNIGGRLYVSGMPRPERRSWLANLEANPSFEFHLKGPVRADLGATARIITDESERRQVLTQVARNWNRDDVDTMVRYSPLIEATIASTE